MRHSIYHCNVSFFHMGFHLTPMLVPRCKIYEMEIEVKFVLCVCTTPSVIHSYDCLFFLFCFHDYSMSLRGLNSVLFVTGLFLLKLEEEQYTPNFLSRRQYIFDFQFHCMSVQYDKYIYFNQHYAHDWSG